MNDNIKYYEAIVNYNDLTYENILKDKIIIATYSYAEAVNKIVSAYGEELINFAIKETEYDLGLYLYGDEQNFDFDTAFE